MIALRTITEENFQQCLNVKTAAEEKDFVDSVAYSLAEAWLYYEDTKAFAICSNNEIVGFVSMYIGDNNPQIINFMIDDAFQNKGYGTQAAKACIHYLQSTYGAKRISAPVRTENTAAQRFWKKLGFQLSDTIENGYVFMRLHLSDA